MTPTYNIVDIGRSPIDLCSNVAGTPFVNITSFAASVDARRLGLNTVRFTPVSNACGAFVVTKHGCANFIPTMPEIEAFAAGFAGLA